MKKSVFVVIALAMSLAYHAINYFMSIVGGFVFKDYRKLKALEMD